MRLYNNLNAPEGSKILTALNNPGYRVTVVSQQALEGIDFANQALASEIRGVVWSDTDSDGTKDLGEPGLDSVTVYLDCNSNGQLDAGEPSTLTRTDDQSTPDVDEAGTYVFTGLEPGIYAVGELAPAGYVQAFPVRSHDEVRRVSLTYTEAQADHACLLSHLSDDGRYVIFASGATNLVPLSVSGTHVFVRDIVAGTTECITVDGAGQPGHPKGFTTARMDISPGGRYAVFASDAGDLVSGDTNHTFDVFLRDRQLGITERMSIAQDGSEPNGFCQGPAVSDDGRYVVFCSSASNLVPNDDNSADDVFLYDRQARTLRLVSAGLDGKSAKGLSRWPDISGDGRYVVFESTATNLVPEDTGSDGNAFLYDIQLGTLQIVSRSRTGAKVGGNGITISTDGRFIAFECPSALDANDNNSRSDIYLRDRQTGEVHWASRAYNSLAGNDYSLRAAISADGHYVAFVSDSSNLVPNDTNGARDIFLYSLDTDAISQVSLTSTGGQVNGRSDRSSVSAGGRNIAFDSYGTNAVPGDTNACCDVFVFTHDTYGQHRINVAQGQLVEQVDFGNHDIVPPAADVVDVTPDPQSAPVNQITIVFSEPVTGVDLFDLRLTMGDGPNLLTSNQTLVALDATTWTLGGIAGLMTSVGTYTLKLVASSSGIVDATGNPILTDASDSWDVNNYAPTDILLSANTVIERQPVGTVVGSISTVDPDSDTGFAYALVCGGGDTDNALFTVVGDELWTAAVLDYEIGASYSVRVRTTDTGGQSFDKAFTINATDVYDFTTCGMYDPATAQFYLSTQNNWGGVNAPFGFGAANWKAVAGDWNGDGQDTIGLFDPSCNQFYLRNANDTGPVDVCFGYGVPNSGQVVVMGDWDGDGDETVGLYTPSASFFELRNSAGGGMAELSLGFGAPGTDSFFDPKVYGTGGANPQAVVSGDFNRDNNADVALTNSGSNTVSVLYGDGRGGLSGAATYSTGGTSPQSLVAAEFNGDGYLDLAVTNRGSNTVGVLLGSATGFAAAKTYSTGGTAPYGIVAGDFNADGKLDLGVTNRSSGNVAVLLGNGTGGFGGASTFSTGGTSPQALVTGDFNADGKLDVAAANAGSNNVSILLGNGAGRFGTATKFASGGATPNGLAVADFDRDGKLDLAVSNGASTIGIGILRGNGSGGFAAAHTYSSGAASPSRIVAGDFNDDGIPDLAMIHGGNVSVMYASLSGGNLSFPTIKGFVSGGNASWLATGDFSGDGKLDLAVANADATGTVSILLNYRWEPVVGDWDGDGKDTIGLYDPMTAMFYLRNSLTTGMADIAFPYGSAQSGWQPLIGDWNGDGKDSAGFFIYNANHFFLRDAFSAGMADYSFAMGEANKGWRPIVGNWRGAVAQPLLAADGPVSSSTTATALTSTAAQPVIDAALARWAELGIAFNTVQVVVTDLPGAMLGQAVGQTIYLDSDAAGHGWFIDPTPSVDEEFAQLGGRNALAAISPAVVDRIDLLSVLEHELGHIAGLGDLDSTLDSLMSGKLPTGVRRQANTPDLDAT